MLDDEFAAIIRAADDQLATVKLMHRGATGAVNSLSPLGERVGVREQTEPAAKLCV
jgi:hypothetical protein